MSDKPEAQPEDAGTEDNAAASAEAPAAEQEQNPSDEPDMVEVLQVENADLKDRLLRAAAEMENMRRRFEREMADARQYAMTGFAREVLSIGDNLGRALGAVPEGAREEGETIKTLLEGVEMTERELLRVLDKHGVKRLKPEGERFDPNFHQAMFEVEHDEAPHGTVVEVIQPGYSIGDRVLRPALVGVAKVSKKPVAEPQSDDTVTEASPDAANDG